MAFAPGPGVSDTSVIRVIAAVLAFHLAAVPASSQGRVLAPIEGRALGVEFVLAPMAKELRRRCTCVSAAFAESRVATYAGVQGEALPLRHVDPGRMIRSVLERQWRDLVERQGARTPDADPDNMYDHWEAAALLVTGRSLGKLQGRDAIRPGSSYTLRRHKRGTETHRQTWRISS